MKWSSLHIIWVCLVQFIFWGALLATGTDLGNPYSILGIHRRSTQSEIRQAYKQLAKEWHPDKNNKDEAAEKFVEIKQAYELLSDPDRRRLYDNKGITEDDFYKRQERAAVFNNFEDLFAHHGAYFNFQDNDLLFFQKLSITTRQYDKMVVPKSEKVPHLLYFYNDWCFPCLHAAPYCRKLVDYLEPLGISFVTVHSGTEANLSRRLSVHTLPCLVLLLDGNVYVYKETITSVQKIIEFIRSKLPYKLVPKVQNDNLDEFLNGWEDNRVRGLLWEPKATVRLRYLVTAYHFRHRVAFGFIDSEVIRDKYQVPHDMDTVLLFNENTSAPMASVSMRDIPSSTLNHVISSNQYLALPRLSSQRMLEAICPSEWNKPRKQLCVVLITDATHNHDAHRQTFRWYAQNAPYNSEKVRFAYIYHDRQRQFVRALQPDGKSVQPLLSVVILWRRDTTHVKYEWLPSKWVDNLNETTSNLEQTIKRLLRTTEALPFEAQVKDLFDEHAKGVIEKTFTRVWQYFDSLYESLGKEHILPAVSILATVMCILSVGTLMAHLVAKEEEDIKKHEAQSGNNNNNTSNANNYQPELRLHELRSEKYNGLIRMIKPGCRTILLILDMQSRQQLIPPFHKAMWPYRKNKTLMFCYMYIERSLTWYKELLQLSLPEERELNINPRNCVGTVLSLNGHRKYFCMFHAKHTERNKKVIRNGALIEKDCESGAFIGFDTSDSESDSEPVLLTGSLLDGLPNWLDRLFEGSTQRYHINYWPEFPIK